MYMYMLCVTGSVAWFWGGCVCSTGLLYVEIYMPFCVQSKGKYLLFIDRVLYSVTGGQHCHGRQDSSRVTGGQAFMEDGAGL